MIDPLSMRYMIIIILLVTLSYLLIQIASCIIGLHREWVALLHGRAALLYGQEVSRRGLACKPAKRLLEPYD